MKIISKIAAMIILPMSVAAAAPIAFVNVNVIPMTAESITYAQTVIVDDAQIIAIGAVASTPVPADAVVVDGTDRYLMPGLAEMHGHVPEGEVSFKITPNEP